MSIKAQDVGCAIETAVPLGLIVNELVSNCLEHAFPENRSGEINVSIEPIGQDELELVVADNGVGMPIDLDPTSPGKFGLYLVNALAEQFHGSIELKKGEGLEVRIRFKEIEPERRRLP